jgi:hypothetical protein
MGYRVLEIGDRKYEYVIGRSHTKVKGLGAFENSIIGEYEQPDSQGRVKITPAILARAITRKLAGEIA